MRYSLCFINQIRHYEVKIFNDDMNHDHHTTKMTINMHLNVIT